MVTCKICNNEYKQITYSHLKQHNITINGYLKLYPNSELLDINIRNKYIGENNHFFGKKHSELSKQKNREKHLGKLSSELNPSKRYEVGKKISESKIAQQFKHTEKTKSKISQSKTNVSIKEKLKISQNISENRKNKGFGNKNAVGNIPWNKNLTKDVDNRIHGGINHHMYGKPSMKGAGISKGDYYDSPLQGKIWLRSSYEIAYAKYLDKNKILWMYEMETFELSDEMTYTPDFFLPQFEKFIDTKGYMRPEAQIKINKFLEEYPWDLEILYKEDLIKLGIKL